MNIEELRSYCLAKKFTVEDFPFGEDTLVFKVKGKIFAITGLNDDGCKVNLKCDPDRAIELRDRYDEIKPGYHMNKKHWNTIEFESTLSAKLLKELIDHSYELVVSSLPIKDRF